MSLPSVQAKIDVTSLIEPSPVVNEIVKAELKDLVERNEALPGLPHVNNRVLDTSEGKWGWTPWVYCGGDNRVFHVQIDGDCVVRMETSNDPSWLRPQPFYAPQKHDFTVCTKEALLFVRFHAENLGDGNVKIGLACR